MGERKRGERKEESESYEYGRTRILTTDDNVACHAKCMRGACGGFFKYPDNYVIVTRGRCKTSRRRFWKLIPEIHFVPVLGYVCVRNIARLIV